MVHSFVNCFAFLGFVGHAKDYRRYYQLWSARSKTVVSELKEVESAFSATVSDLENGQLGKAVSDGCELAGALDRTSHVVSDLETDFEKDRAALLSSMDTAPESFYIGDVEDSESSWKGSSTVGCPSSHGDDVAEHVELSDTGDNLTHGNVHGTAAGVESMDSLSSTLRGSVADLGENDVGSFLLRAEFRLGHGHWSSWSGSVKSRTNCARVSTANDTAQIQAHATTSAQLDCSDSDPYDSDRSWFNLPSAGPSSGCASVKENSDQGLSCAASVGDVDPTDQPAGAMPASACHLAEGGCVEASRVGCDDSLNVSSDVEFVDENAEQSSPGMSPIPPSHLDEDSDMETSQVCSDDLLVSCDECSRLVDVRVCGVHAGSTSLCPDIRDSQHTSASLSHPIATKSNAGFSSLTPSCLPRCLPGLWPTRAALPNRGHRTEADGTAPSKKCAEQSDSCLDAVDDCLTQDLMPRKHLQPLVRQRVEELQVRQRVEELQRGPQVQA